MPPPKRQQDPPTLPASLRNLSLFSGLQSFLQVFTATLTRSPFCKEKERRGLLDPAPPPPKTAEEAGRAGGEQDAHRRGVDPLVDLSEEAFSQDPPQGDVLPGDPVVLDLTDKGRGAEVAVPAGGKLPVPLPAPGQSPHSEQEMLATPGYQPSPSPPWQGPTGPVPWHMG